MFASSLTLAAAWALPVPGNATELPLAAAGMVPPAATVAVEGATLAVEGATVAVEGAAVGPARPLQNLLLLLL